MRTAWFLDSVSSETYRIRLIKRTVRVQVGKFFCSWGFVKHLYNRNPRLAFHLFHISSIPAYAGESENAPQSSHRIQGVWDGHR